MLLDYLPVIDYFSPKDKWMVRNEDLKLLRKFKIIRNGTDNGIKNGTKKIIHMWREEWKKDDVPRDEK